MSLHLRAAQDSDYEAFTRWFPKLDTGDPIPTRRRWADGIAPHTTVAEHGGRPAGYCYFQTFSRDGYVRHVVVDEDARRCGVGRALMQHAAAQMRSRGCTRWRLNVRPDNEPAVNLYQGMGMRQTHASASFRFDWSLLERLPAPDPRFSLVSLDPSNPDDRRALEARFDISEGQLEALAARGEVKVRRLVDAQNPDALDLGVTAFDTGFPGCFPYRAAQLEGAIAMLHALRPLALLDDMGVVVEDHPQWDDCLLQAGGRVAFRFVHLVGPLATA